MVNLLLFIKRYFTFYHRLFQACIEPVTAKDGKVTSVYVEQSDNNEEFIIANLNLKNFNESIDLSFNEGEKICFKIDGSGTVHLTGNLLDDPPPGDMFDMEDSEEDSEDSEAGSKIKEVSDNEAAKILKRKKDQPAVEVKKKKAKVVENGDSTIDTTLGDLDDTDNFAEEEDSDDDSSDDGETTSEKVDTTAASDDDSDDDSDDNSDDDDSDDSDEEEEVEKKPKKETPKKDASVKEVKSPKQDPKSSIKEEVKTPKQEVKTPKQETKTPKQDAKIPKEPKTPKEEGKTPKTENKTPGKTPKRTIKGGIQVEDLKEGSGQEVKTGTLVGMFYEGITVKHLRMICLKSVCLCPQTPYSQIPPVCHQLSRIMLNKNFASLVVRLSHFVT